MPPLLPNSVLCGIVFGKHVEVNWETLKALLKALLATVVVLSALVVAFGRIGL